VIRVFIDGATCWLLLGGCELEPIALGGLTVQCRLAAMSAAQGSRGRRGPRVFCCCGDVSMYALARVSFPDRATRLRRGSQTTSAGEPEGS